MCVFRPTRNEESRQVYLSSAHSQCPVKSIDSDSVPKRPTSKSLNSITTFHPPTRSKSGGKRTPTSPRIVLDSSSGRSFFFFFLFSSKLTCSPSICNMHATCSFPWLLDFALCDLIDSEMSTAIILLKLLHRTTTDYANNASQTSWRHKPAWDKCFLFYISP